MVYGQPLIIIRESASATGFLEPVIFVSSLVSSTDQEKILLANGDQVLKLDTSDWRTAAHVTQNDDHLIYTLDWHSGTGDIYWSDQIPQDEEFQEDGDMGIYVYNEESGTVSSITHGINVPAIAVDWIHNNLYFSNRASHTISVYSINTHYTQEIYSGEGAAELESIVLDPRDNQRYMYIADGQDASSITRCGLDGGNCTKVMETDAGSPRYPHGLTIDFQDNKLYWVDDFHEQIIKTDLEPPFQEELVFNVNDNTAVIWGMDILTIHNSIYYTDTANNAFHHLRCDPNCVNETLLIGGGLQHPTALKTMHESRQPAETNTCGSADCSLCLPRGNDIVTSQLPYQCHGGDTRTDVTNISPTHGSIEGGTPLVIKIREQDRPYINAGETYTICLDVNYQNLLCRFEGLLDAAMYTCVTFPLPADQSSLIGTAQPLFLFWDGHPQPKPLHSDITYTYQEHPTVTNIYPREIIVSGGTTITVEGTNLDVIVYSVLVMHVEVLRQPDLNRNIRVDCSLVTTANSSIQLHCTAPMLDFLSKQINQTVTQCENSGRYGCYERIIEIYLGMIFDNSTIFEDLRHHSDSGVVKLSKIKAIFKDPEIGSVGKHEVKSYWPNSVGSIKIPVTNLNIGTLQNQFTVTFSGHPLKKENVDFLDDAIECHFPKEEPELLDGQEMHPLVINIGSLSVEAARVKYTTSIFSCVPCTAGIFAGVALVIIIIVIITASCCVVKISRASGAPEKDNATETTGLGKRRNVVPPPIDLQQISSTSANSSNSTVPPMTPHRSTPPVTPHQNTPPVMPYPNTSPPIISHPNTPPIMRHPSTLPTRPLPNKPSVMPHPNELSARSHPSTPPPMMPHPNTSPSLLPSPPVMRSPRYEDDEGGSGYLKPGGTNSVYQSGGYLDMRQGNEDGYLRLQDNQQSDYVKPQPETTYQNGTFYRANRDTISASGVIMGSHDQLPGGSHGFTGDDSHTQWDAYTGNGHHDPTSQHHQNVQHYLRSGDAAY